MSRPLEKWTIGEAHASRYRVITCGGGARRDFLVFDFRIGPTRFPGIEVVLSPEAHPTANLWIEPLERGILQGVAQLREEGKDLVGVRIEITNIIFHDVDTTESGCEKRGRHFIEALKNKWVPASSV